VLPRLHREDAVEQAAQNRQAVSVLQVAFPAAVVVVL
jgi:hypothetical protein